MRAAPTGTTIMGMGTTIMGMGRVTEVGAGSGAPAPPSDLGLARRRLWQLISPTLPVGAYSYSTGLEQAVEAGWLRDADAVRGWIEAQLLQVHARVDLPALIRLYQACVRDEPEALEHWNDWLRASRETSELRAEDLGQGRALARLLADLGLGAAVPWAARNDGCWATLFALAAVAWSIPCREALEGYLWAWCENQTAAAIKLVPLGQTQGQRLLLALATSIAAAVDRAETVEDAAMGSGLPGIVLSSALHETQYSRMFRS
jgi:urease accessory protein